MLIHVSSYYYLCVAYYYIYVLSFILLYESSFYYICVLTHHAETLLVDTTRIGDSAYIGSYFHTCVSHATIYESSYYYATIYESSYYKIRVLTRRNSLLRVVT